MVSLKLEIKEFTVTSEYFEQLSLKIFEKGRFTVFKDIDNSLFFDVEDLSNCIYLEFYRNGEVIIHSSLYLLPLLISDRHSVSLYPYDNGKEYCEQGRASENHIKLEFYKLQQEHLQTYLSREVEPQRSDVKPVELLETFGDWTGLNVNKLLETCEIANPKAELIKNILIGVNSKLKAAETIRTPPTESKNDTLNRLLGSLATLNALEKSQNDLISQLTVQNAGLIHELSQEKQKNSDLSKQIDTHKATIAELQAHNDQMGLNQSELFKNLTQTQKPDHSIEIFESDREQAINAFKQQIKKLEETINPMEQYIKELIQENSLCRNQITALNGKIMELNQKNAELEINLNAIVCEKQELSSKLLLSQAPQSSPGNPKAFEAASAQGPPSDKLEGKVSSMQGAQPIDSSKLLELSEQNNYLLEKLKSCLSEIEFLKDELKNQEDIIKIISIQNMNISTINKISSIPNFEQDISDLFLQINQIKNLGVQFDCKVCRQTEEYFVEVNGVNLRHLALHRLMQKVIRLVCDKACELFLLRNIALDAQRDNKSYVPVRTDPVDVCMADFINNRDPPLAIPIIREDQGIYLFNSRKIKVKIENNKVIVRLGGGFEGIEDFISLNMQAEVDKIEERKKFGASNSMKNVIEQDLSYLGLISKLESSQDISFSNNSLSITSSGKKKLNRVISKDSISRSLQKKKTIS